MKTLEEYLTLPYRMEIVPDPDEGGYAVFFPDLKGCGSCGETIEEAVAHAQEAKTDWLMAAIEDKRSIPEPVDEEVYSGNFKLRMPKSLHKALAVNAKRDGVSMNQYCVYLLAKSQDISYPSR